MLPTNSFLFSLCTTVLLCILGSFESVSSYPTGAGTCIAGPAVLASSSPHLAEYGKGTLLDGGYTTSFENGTYTLRATGSGNYFSGFLFRLSSNDTSAAGAFQLRNLYSNVTQLMNSTGEGLGSFSAPATCGVDVAGVTHREDSEKTEVSVGMKLQSGYTYSLMVTVVKEEDEWYYSQELYGNAASTGVETSAEVSVAPTSSSTETLLPTPSPLSKPATITEAPVAPSPATQATSSSATVQLWSALVLITLMATTSWAAL